MQTDVQDGQQVRVAQDGDRTSFAEESLRRLRRKLFGAENGKGHYTAKRSVAGAFEVLVDEISQRVKGALSAPVEALYPQLAETVGTRSAN